MVHYLDQGPFPYPFRSSSPGILTVKEFVYLPNAVLEPKRQKTILKNGHVFL
jgi:hypothetical protein